jgi:aspartate/methionine/tyrosine aminotransferase
VVDVPLFELVEWMHRNEPQAKYRLGSSNIYRDATAPGPVDWSAIAEEMSTYQGYARASQTRYPDMLAGWLGVPRAELLPTMGTSEANSLVVHALSLGGERFVVDVPNYQPLFGLPPLYGARVDMVPRHEADGWRLDLEAVKAACRPGTTAIFTCNLHNPTGAALMREELRALGDIAADAGAVLVVDEIFRHFVEDDSMVPPVRSVVPEAVATGSLSKVYGWGATRMGWVTGPAELVERVRRLKVLVAPTSGLPNEAISVQVVGALPELRKWSKGVAKRGTEALRAWVESRDDVAWVPPYAGIISFPRLERVRDTVALAKRALAEKGVMVSPGEYFGMPGHLRIGVGLPDRTVIDEGLQLLGEVIDST